jgi:hypothetical protein
MELFPLFQSLEQSPFGQGIKTSPWAFPITESVHLLALSVIGGAVLVVDLRMLGLGLKRQSIAELAREAWPVFVASWVAMLVTGFLLFASEAVKCYYSTPFRVKMVCLLLATLFTVTVKRRVTLADVAHARPMVLKLVALVSMALWLGVGAGGRWIGFSG